MTPSPFIQHLMTGGQLHSESNKFLQHVQQTFAAPDSGYVDVRNYDRAVAEPSISAQHETLPRTQDLAAMHHESDRLKRIGRQSELHMILGDKASQHVIYVRLRNSRSRLSCDHAMFEDICTSINAFDKIRDVVLCFAIRKSDLHRPPPLLTSTFHIKDDVCTQEITYVLRFVEPNNRSDGFTWSLRQTGVYHKSRGLLRDDSWLFFGLPPALEQLLHAYMLSIACIRDVHPLEAHYLILRHSMFGWKDCLFYLGELIQEQADIVLMTDIDPSDFSMSQLEQRQYLKRIEDFLLELSAAVTHTQGHISRLHKCAQRYRPLKSSRASTSAAEEEAGDEDGLSSALLDENERLMTFKSQLQTMHDKVKSISTLVSTVLDLSNGDALKRLAIETKTENSRTAILTRKAVEDAATVKVLTIITLVYLPLTVVTNFFSTSFVNVSDDSSITLTSDTWILFVIGIPLTAITIYVWWVFSRKEIRGAYPNHLRRASQILGKQLSGNVNKTIHGNEIYEQYNLNDTNHREI